jgi:phage shock protein A
LNKQKLSQEKVYREKEVQHLAGIITETTNQIAQIEAKLEEVQQKYRLLIQRGVHAVEKKQVRKIMKEATGAKVLTRFDQLENRIERMEAEAELSGSAAVGSFDKEFTDMEQNALVEEELAALKSQIKVKPTTKTTASKSAEVKEA